MSALRPHGLWPTRPLRPWDFQARILEWVAISFMGFSRQAYWSGSPFPYPAIEGSVIQCIKKKKSLAVSWSSTQFSIVPDLQFMNTYMFFLSFFFFFFFLTSLHGVWEFCSLTRDWTHTPCIGSVESSQLDHQGNPIHSLFFPSLYIHSLRASIFLSLFLSLKSCIRHYDRHKVI